VAYFVAAGLGAAFRYHLANFVGASLNLLLADEAANIVANGLCAALRNHTADFVVASLRSAFRNASSDRVRAFGADLFANVLGALDFLRVTLRNPNLLAAYSVGALASYNTAAAWAVDRTTRCGIVRP